MGRQATSVGRRGDTIAAQEIVQPEVPFSIGPAVLYIRQRPGADEGPLAPITIYEGWVEPDSAVRPQ